MTVHHYEKSGATEVIADCKFYNCTATYACEPLECYCENCDHPPLSIFERMDVNFGYRNVRSRPPHVLFLIGVGFLSPSPPITFNNYRWSELKREWKRKRGFPHLNKGQRLNSCTLHCSYNYLLFLFPSPLILIMAID